MTFIEHFDRVKAQLSAAPSPKLRERTIHTKSMTAISYRTNVRTKSNGRARNGASAEERFFARVEKTADGHWLLFVRGLGRLNLMRAFMLAAQQ